MYSLRSKFWPAYTWKIQTTYLNEYKDSLTKESKISQEEFKHRLSDIFEKINASFYHLEKLKEDQQVAVDMGKKLAKIIMPGTENLPGIAGAPYEPIGYEYESFLITVKTMLDLVATLITKCVGRGEDNIISLISNIDLEKLREESLERKIMTFVKSDYFKEFLEDYRNPKDDKNKSTKRNFAAHHGSLPLGTTNVPINNPRASVILVKPIDHNATDPDHFPKNAPDLVDYCDDHFYQACDLFIGVISILLNNEFKAGRKSSVYEESLKRKS